MGMLLVVVVQIIVIIMFLSIIITPFRLIYYGIEEGNPFDIIIGICSVMLIVVILIMYVKEYLQ